MVSTASGSLLFVLSDALFRCLNVRTQMTMFHDAIVSEAGPPGRSAGADLFLSVIGTQTERVMPLVAGGGSGETCRLLEYTLRGLAEQVKQNGLAHSRIAPLPVRSHRASAMTHGRGGHRSVSPISC